MKLFLLPLLWLCMGTALAAQEPTQPARLELPLDAYNSEVSIQPLPADSSVVLLVEQLKPGAYTTTLSFQKYNHQLSPVWSSPLEVPKGFSFDRLTADGMLVYALFRHDLLAKQLWIAELDAQTGAVYAHMFEAEDVRSIYDFRVLRGQAFLTVMVENHLTALLLNLRRNRIGSLPAIYEQLPTNFTFSVDPLAHRVDFISSQSNGYKTRLQVKELSAEGQLVRSEFVQAESDRNLLMAQLSPGFRDRLLLGTYSLRDTRYAQGLFVADLNEAPTLTGSRRSLRFYDFLNLKHFFDFVSPKRAVRLKVRGEQMRATNRHLRLHYRLLTHELLPTPEGYVLVGEVYNQRFRNTVPYQPNTGMPLGAYNNTEGYYTTHAIVCGFDRQGNLLWDNTFVLQNARSYDLVEMVQLRPLPGGRRFVMAYLDEYRIRYKIIDGANASSNDLMVPVQTTLANAKEKANNATQQGMLAWYGSRFLAFGYQHIRGANGASRDVYFLNAVAFDGTTAQ
ncbi:hypothetical protein MUN82_00475 [Hymenobacter aerilatus]|uniref:Transcriptional regulator n=1 Tax=Hymenobacter aerilatus TaxID=2932251 RepID=A0A8T9SZD0_9BACT|nr:hypothetical protein [Hymenobacter aerilatus]UOR05590.1 hypothetical protein MUN82_00475 [Hymenobacter aerilatus]